MNIKKVIAKLKKDFKWNNFSNILLTFFLVVVAFLQFGLANELGNIQKSTEHEKFINSRKELRKISRDIFGSFSYKGLDERLTHTPEDNMALARKLYGLLLEGSANPLLAHDPESLKHWYKAISAIEFYDYVSPKDVGMQKEDGKVLTASDVEANKIVVDSLGIAWQEAMKAYLKLGLSSYDFLRDLEHKNK